MKKLIIAALFIAATNIAFAQSNATPNPGKNFEEQRAYNETDRLNRQVNLTADQKLKIQDINLKTEMELKKYRESGAKAEPEKMKSVMMKRNEQYKAVLTADQYSKYQQIHGGPRK